MSSNYESGINAVRNMEPFQVGMMVIVMWPSGDLGGHIEKDHGIDANFKMHTYDVRMFDGRKKYVFECDMDRVVFNGAVQDAMLRQWTEKMVQNA